MKVWYYQYRENTIRENGIYMDYYLITIIPIPGTYLLPVKSGSLGLNIEKLIGAHLEIRLDLHCLF